MTQRQIRILNKKKRELIDASSDKKNAAYKGFMGKIREMMEEGIYAVDEAGVGIRYTAA